MDLKMRDMDGLEATRIIKSRHPGLPVIAQTAHALAGDKKKAMDAGCDDYLTKPIHKAELKEKLARFGLVSNGITGKD
jgi:CheY-like chemotaxis protein